MECGSVQVAIIVSAIHVRASSLLNITFPNNNRYIMPFVLPITLLLVLIADSILNGPIKAIKSIVCNRIGNVENARDVTKMICYISYV
jgi:hypothetical protein